jgi:hypothetical protein
MSDLDRFPPQAIERLRQRYIAAQRRRPPLEQLVADLEVLFHEHDLPVTCRKDEIGPPSLCRGIERRRSRPPSILLRADEVIE